MESPVDRFSRFQHLTNAIMLHDPERNFSSLVDNHKQLFSGFKVVYSTSNLENEFSNSSLTSIEKDCPVLKKFFYGTGLLYYTDDLYEKTKQSGKTEIPIDYSLSLDSNVAEKFRVWENGGSLGNQLGRFENLVRFIKEGKEEGFNFDYNFFIIENLIDSMKEGNHRPFNTIRALKRFDHLVYDKLTFDVNSPVFDENREMAGRRAIDTLHTYHSSPEGFKFLNRRKGLYLILLKTVILNQDINLSLKDKMKILVEFSLDTLGKFAKNELYFSWKLLKYGKELKFFSDPISQLTEKSIGKIRGMSWDLFAFRYQETLSSKDNLGEFYVPFFASFDNKFVDLAHACPIRCIVIDSRDKRVTTIHLDESEFQSDLSLSLNDELLRKLQDPEEKIKRLNYVISPEYLDSKVNTLEADLRQHY